MENKILTPGINRNVIPVLFKDREYSNKSVLPPEVRVYGNRIINQDGTDFKPLDSITIKGKPNRFISFIKNLFKWN